MASEVLKAQIPSRRPNTPTPDSDEEATRTYSRPTPAGTDLAITATFEIPGIKPEA